jgi:zinc protease
MEIGGLEMAGFSWRDENTLFEQVRTVTADEVRAAARSLTSDQQLTVTNLVPLPIDPKAPKTAPSFFD